MPDRLVDLVQQLGRPTVVVVGDYMLDRYVWGSAERLSPEAPIPVLKADRYDERPGGAGSVVADLAALGARPAVAGIVGQDPAGRRLRALLAQTGARVNGLLMAPRRPTTVKTRLIARSQQIVRVDEETNAELDAATATRLTALAFRAVRTADVVLVQDHAKGTVTRQLIAALIRACHARSVPVIIDPAATGDYSKYHGCTLMTPNRAETRHATGIAVVDEETAALAARKLIRSLGLQAAALTLDRDGIAVCEKGGRAVLVPARAVEVFDVTGAGDMVAAAMAVALASGANLFDAARLANVAAGIEVGKLGAATVSKREILERLSGGAESKFKSGSDLVTLCSDLHSRGHTIVFTNGCFDLLHVGHVRLLTEAKKFGDVLVVAINSDASARRIKGPGRPIIGEDARAAMLAALECVDYVTVYAEDTPVPLLRLMRPDVIVKGAEYGRAGVVGGRLVESLGGRIELVPMVSGVSTTRIAEKAHRHAKKKAGTRGYVRPDR